MLGSTKMVVVASVVGALAVAGVAAAALTLSYVSSTTSTGVKPAPIVFEAGPDAAYKDYVPELTLSPNATSFRMSLRGIPEVPVAMSDLLRIRNVDERAHDVTLTTSQIANPYVLAYELSFHDGATKVATLDLKSASPALTLAGMEPGKVYTVRAFLSLASGAGAHNVADERSLAVGVSP